VGTTVTTYIGKTTTIADSVGRHRPNVDAIGDSRLTADEIEDTVYGAGGWKTFVQGLKDAGTFDPDREPTTRTRAGTPG